MEYFIKEFNLGSTKIKISDEKCVSPEETEKILKRIKQISYEALKKKAEREMID